MKDEKLRYWTAAPNVFLVAKSKESKRILGCIGYKEIAPKRVEINHLSVDQNFRGLKIGENLVKFLIGTARENGFDTIYLTTSTAQNEALKLYEKFGFEFLHFEPMRMLAYGIGFSHLCGLKKMAFLKRIE